MKPWRPPKGRNQKSTFHEAPHLAESPWAHKDISFLWTLFSLAQVFVLTLFESWFVQRLGWEFGCGNLTVMSDQCSKLTVLWLPISLYVRLPPFVGQGAKVDSLACQSSNHRSCGTCLRSPTFIVPQLLQAESLIIESIGGQEEMWSCVGGLGHGSDRTWPCFYSSLKKRPHSG